MGSTGNKSEWGRGGGTRRARAQPWGHHFRQCVSTSHSTAGPPPQSMGWHRAWSRLLGKGVMEELMGENAFKPQVVG